jgi:two-component system sensor histidine kinase PrrB
VKPFRSLRARLALATASAVAVVVIIAGVALVRAANDDQYRVLDDSLRDRADLVESPAKRAVIRGSAPLLDSVADILGSGFVVRVVDRDGALRYSSGILAGDPWPDVADGIHSVTARGREWRTLRRPLGLRQLDAVVAFPLAPTRDAVTTFRRRAIFVGAGAVAAAAAAGWLLGTWVLRPLRTLRRGATRVAETRDLSLTIPAVGPPEVDSVIESLNTMLHRLDESVQSERDALATSRSFAANVTHELRTPLTSLRTNLDVLRLHHELDPTRRDELTDEAHRSAARLAELLASLEVLARGDLARDAFRDAVDLSVVVDAAVDAARTRHPDVEFEVVQPEDTVELVGWPEGLRVLVDNLLDNAAVHGAPEAGRARVRVELARESDDAVLTICDRGPGIPDEQREAVMTPFVRGTDTTVPGSGLGLAIVDQQARLHHGTVQITSEPESGARVRVTLARAASPSSAGHRGRP